MSLYLNAYPPDTQVFSRIPTISIQQFKHKYAIIEAGRGATNTHQHYISIAARMQHMNNSITDPIPSKTCTKCGTTLPHTLEFFTRARWRKDGTPYLHSHCRKCHSVMTIANKLRWQRENPEQARDYQRRYVAQNREHIKERRKKHRVENPGYYREYNRLWRAANKEKLKQKYRAWKIKNPEKHRIALRRCRAQRRGLPATLTTEQWRQCLAYFNGCCAYCGSPPGLWLYIAQEHFIPVSKSGGYTADNIIPACHAKKDAPAGTPACNNSKYNKDVEDWLAERFDKRKAKAILRRIQEYFKYVNRIESQNAAGNGVVGGSNS